MSLSHPHIDLEPVESPARSGLSLRAAGLGLGTVVFISLWVTYAETVLHTSRLSLSDVSISGIRTHDHGPHPQ